MRRLTKFKLKQLNDGAHQVRVEYRVARESAAEDEFSMSVTDLVDPELVERMDALTEDVARICELRPDTLTMVGLTLTDSGVLLTALRELSAYKTPMVINTPLIRFDELALETTERIRDLREIIWEFVDGGARAQQSLELATA